MGNKKSKQLSPEELIFLEKNTKFTRKEIKQWHRGFIKDCPGGLLTEHTFKKVYANFFPGGNAEGFCKHVFRSFDRDKSGKIEFTEFLRAVNITMNDVDPKDKLEWAFILYDIDGNGIIEKKEMTLIIQAMYDMLGEAVKGLALDTAAERTEKIFKIVDKNHDSVLTKAEFIQGCLKDKCLFQMLTAHANLEASGSDSTGGVFLGTAQSHDREPRASTNVDDMSLKRIGKKIEESTSDTSSVTDQDAEMDFVNDESDASSESGRSKKGAR